MGEVTAEGLCDRYQELYTGLVADALDDRGYTDQILDSKINPLQRDMKTTGIAFPAMAQKNRGVEYESEARTFVQMLSEVPEHSVLMFQANDTECAHIGELTTLALSNQGCRGAVIDGGGRDSHLMLKQELPVFLRSRTPGDSLTRSEILDWGIETVVGGVAVSPGDMVIADIDGVVVVPQEIRLEVLQEAEKMAAAEDDVRAAIRDGVSPEEAFDRYGTF